MQKSEERSGQCTVASSSSHWRVGRKEVEKPLGLVVVG